MIEKVTHGLKGRGWRKPAFNQWRVLHKLSSCQQVSDVPSTERVCLFPGTAVRSKESERPWAGRDAGEWGKS